MVSKKTLNELTLYKSEVNDIKRILFEKTIPTMADYLNLHKNFTHEEFILAAVEFVPEFPPKVLTYNKFHIKSFQ